MASCDRDPTATHRDPGHSRPTVTPCPPLNRGHGRVTVDRGTQTSQRVPPPAPSWLAGWMELDDRRRAETMAAGKARLQQRGRA
jgi:hypothetical protein